MPTGPRVKIKKGYSSSKSSLAGQTLGRARETTQNLSEVEHVWHINKSCTNMY